MYPHRFGSPYAPNVQFFQQHQQQDELVEAQLSAAAATQTAPMQMQPIQVPMQAMLAAQQAAAHQPAVNRATYHQAAAHHAAAHQAAAQQAAVKQAAAHQAAMKQAAAHQAAVQQAAAHQVAVQQAAAQQAGMAQQVVVFQQAAAVQQAQALPMNNVPRVQPVMMAPVMHHQLPAAFAAAQAAAAQNTVPQAASTFNQPALGAAVMVGVAGPSSGLVPMSPSDTTINTDPLAPTPEELQGMELNDLMDIINPDMFYDMQYEAPQLVDELIAQHRTLHPEPAPPSDHQPLKPASSMMNKQRTLRRAQGGEFREGSDFAVAAAQVAAERAAAGPKPGLLRRTHGGEFRVGSEFAAAAAQVAAEAAAANASRKRDSPSGERGLERTREQRKQLRAERNRQSAASSRSRKKAHIVELNRRLKILKLDNARLEKHELDALRSRMFHEKELLEENSHLKATLSEGKAEIERLKKRVEDVQRKVEERNKNKVIKELKRPNTWDNGKLSDSINKAMF